MARPVNENDKGRAVCLNRKARFLYEVLETVEAGLVLTGSEVKSLRDGLGQLADAYAFVGEGQPMLKGLEITPYVNDHSGTTRSKRARKLLLHKAQIAKLATRARERGVSLVPLSIYFRGPWAKVELAVAKGRRKADKRQAIKEREHERDIDRATRRR